MKLGKLVNLCRLEILESNRFAGHTWKTSLTVDAIVANRTPFALSFEGFYPQ